MQLSLFGSDDTNQCGYPNVSGVSGWRYGCRCPRCSEAHARSMHPTGLCSEPGCTGPRLKHRKYCATHRPPPRQRKVLSEAACELDGRVHCWYESVLSNMRPEIRDLYRRTCGECRKGYLASIKHHRLDTRQAMYLITARTCGLCGERFPIDSNGRRRNAVDHDHACCWGPHSCGRCVRGVLCNQCNHDIGTIERMRKIGFGHVYAYIDGRF